MSITHVLQRLSIAGLFAIMAAAMVVTAKATVPEPPIDLVAQLVRSSNTPVGSIRLEWSPARSGATADGYRIYMSMAANGAVGDFVQIGGTTTTWFEISDPRPGAFVFYVTAYNGDGESQPSDLAKILVDGPPDPVSTIYFTSVPPREATVGVPYRYDADAVDPNGGEVRYRIGEAPLGAPFPYAEGITVDNLTGVVEWTPSRTGLFAAAVYAYLASDTNEVEMQVVIVNVTTPPCAVIRGTVLNVDGSVVEDAFITAISVNDNSGANWATSASAPSTGGEYALDVPEGTYVIVLKHPIVGAIWYKDALDISTAEHVTVACGETAAADFIVKSPPEPTKFTVSGRVSRLDEGSGVDAVVEFMLRDRNGRPIDPATGVIYPNAFATRTDADGYYTVELIDGFEYIAQALPNDDALLSQYYDRVSTPSDATPITAPTNAGINFILTARPVYNNGIDGTVADSAGAPLEAEVMVMRVPTGANVPDPTNTEYARATKTEADGSYRLRNLIPGAYVVFAMPSDREYAPGYYVENAGASLGWRGGTTIVVDETTVATGKDIVLQRRDGKRGFARIGGYVRVGPGSTKSDRTVLGGDPLSGVFIYALDGDDRVSDYTFSDPSGWFELSELGAADYRIFADKVGYGSAVFTENLDYNGRSSVDKDIVLPNGTSSVDDLVVGNRALRIHPNPAASRITLQFDAAGDEGTVTIVDALGRGVRTLEITTTDGANVVPIDLSGLGAGYYRVQVHSGRVNASTGFIVVR